MARPGRPPGRAAYGLTEAGHVVELPRRPSAERDDPLRLVTGPGWPAWYPATDADRPERRINVCEYLDQYRESPRWGVGSAAGRGSRGPPATSAPKARRDYPR